MKKRNLIISAAVVLVVTAVFLFYNHGTRGGRNLSEEEGEASSKIEPLVHKQVQEEINGNVQVINILEVNIKDRRVYVTPVLSHDSIFGFEKTSAMANRKKADAAINGGFFYPYGQPAGFVVIDSKLLCTAPKLNDRPVFIIDEHRNFKILDIDIELELDIEGYRLKIDGINRNPREDEIIVYTPEYGLTTRINGRATFNVIADDNIISDFILSETEVKIPRNGLLVAAAGEKIRQLESFIAYKRKNIKVVYNTFPSYGKIVQALEGGFWVVKDGRKVVREREPWVGLMTNREPRTVVGTKNENTAIFMTIDGRQPGYSTGLTGDELAGYLLSKGINNALMLDGGASTTMVVNGKVVNSPSYRGRERDVGGAIIIKVDK
ncbi:MAG: hypothetical protein PWR27_723 [Petroclostridium sp.]|jgi:exopolysaccharide biosynthesis protein|nr:hypothetical protein [Petroclostridium sp.]